MLDIKYVRENPDAIDAAMASRQTSWDRERFFALDDERRAVITQVEELGRFSLVFLQTITRGDEVVCTLRVKVACVDLATKRLARLDDRLIEALS